MKRWAAAAALVLLLSLTAAATASTAAAEFQPPQDDVPEELEDDFHKLWSKYHADNDPATTDAMEFLGSSTGYYWIDPPGAPDTWNQHQVERYDRETTRTTSIHPRGASTRDGAQERIRDAYVEIFSVTPSTLVHAGGTPEEVLEGVEEAPPQGLQQREEIYFVSPEGGEVEVLLDYRVDAPLDERVDVYLFDDFLAPEDVQPEDPSSLGDVAEEIQDNDPLVQRTDVHALQGGGGVSLPYDEVDVSASTLQVVVMVFDDSYDEVVVMQDNVEVTPFDFDLVPARAARYPDGDVAHVFPNLPPEGWSSIRLSDGSSVHSNYRFFSARDTDWDEVAVAGSGASPPSIHPLTVHAYPSRSGSAVSGEAEVLRAAGPPYGEPRLPDDVAFDTHPSTYISHQMVAFRHDASTHNLHVEGVVRGSRAEPMMEAVTHEIIETDLKIEIVRQRGEEIQLAIELEDELGNPLDTRTGDDYIEISGGREVHTGLDGTAVVNTTNPADGAVTVEYHSEFVDSFAEGRGVGEETLYLGSRDVAYTDRDYDPGREAGMLLQLLVFLTPFFFLVYMLDGMLDLDIWPPWRGL